MKPSLYCAGGLLLCLANSLPCWAQANWITPAVRRQLGVEVPPGTPDTAPDTSKTKEYQLPGCRLVSYTVAYFDTVATWAQGRVVDAVSYRPVAGAFIQVSFSCFSQASLCQVKTAVTDSAGFFRLGWVGCAGPAGGQAPRPLQVRATGYPTFHTRQVEFGGLAYLHIELAAGAENSARPAGKRLRKPRANAPK